MHIMNYNYLDCVYSIFGCNNYNIIMVTRTGSFYGTNGRAIVRAGSGKWSHTHIYTMIIIHLAIPLEQG